MKTTENCLNFLIHILVKVIKVLYLCESDRTIHSDIEE